MTRLSTSGGFLKAGNTTLLIGVEDDEKDEVLLTVTMPGDAFIPYPLEVKVGGATVFVVDVEQFVRI